MLSIDLPVPIEMAGWMVGSGGGGIASLSCSSLERVLAAGATVGRISESPR